MRKIDPSRLLPTLAEELWHQAQQYVPDVLAHSASAVPAPFGYFIVAQGEPRASEFQLPEPLLGPIAPDELQVLVVGLNPGYGPTESIPKLTTDLDAYIGWYAHRFSPERRDWAARPASVFGDRTRVVHHYARVERDYLDPALGAQSFGRAAVYADAIPWKWNAEQNPDLGDPAVALAEPTHAATERAAQEVEGSNQLGLTSGRSNWRDIMLQADRARQALCKDRAQGEEEFRQLLEHDPRDGMLYLRRSQARAAVGDTAGALSDLQRAEALLPRPEWKQQAREARQKLLGQDNRATRMEPGASPGYARLTQWLSDLGTNRAVGSALWSSTSAT